MAADALTPRVHTGVGVAGVVRMGAKGAMDFQNLGRTMRLGLARLVTGKSSQRTRTSGLGGGITTRPAVSHRSSRVEVGPLCLTLATVKRSKVVSTDNCWL
jgi:hypothetical protein